MSVLYPSLRYNKVCYKGTALAVLRKACVNKRVTDLHDSSSVWFAFFSKSFMANSDGYVHNVSGIRFHFENSPLLKELNVPVQNFE